MLAFVYAPLFWKQLMLIVIKLVQQHRKQARLKDKSSFGAVLFEPRTNSVDESFYSGEDCIEGLMEILTR